jgi:hypothetical protein
MKTFLTVITLLISISAIAAPEPRTMICDFDGENSSRIYSVTTMPGIGVTFRLPDGVKITDFVVTDYEYVRNAENG